MIKFTDVEIYKLLPEYFNTKEMIALSYAIHRKISFIQQCSAKTRFGGSIDDLPEDVLDLLAIEWNALYYDNSYDISTKRKIIKESMLINMIAGSEDAINKMISAIYGDGKVIEWYDYQGEPNHFKIQTPAILTKETYDTFSRIIKKIKKVVNVLDYIEVLRNCTATLYSIALSVSVTKPAAIIDGFSYENELQSIIAHGVAESNFTRQPALTDGFSIEGEDITGTVSQYAGQSHIYKNEAITDGFTVNNSVAGESVHLGVVEFSITKSHLSDNA